MTPPVKSRRRAANLVTTFTADEVRVMDTLCSTLAADEATPGMLVLVASNKAFVSVADKFARLREKARTGS